MARVLGIGGVFFKAEAPKALAAWYARVLGFPVEDWGGAQWPHPDRGYSLWTAFPRDTTHFAPSEAPFMINLIVEDLDGVLAKAASEGVEPLGRDDSDAYGRFAWIMDPAGLKVELWEPPSPAP
ncbi:VOC family protein [Phenylobacterium aquaticum]|uniref:VOC family protein n=1 Tax=Phenylobacterium aquaticum TaxID=1763816 RepID=UPI0026EF97BA|nr:VOC family protein [Phenylobacterium aquaticum]